MKELSRYTAYIANLTDGHVPPEYRISLSSGEYHPRKHKVQGYAAQNRAARKRRNQRKK